MLHDRQALVVRRPTDSIHVPGLASPCTLDDRQTLLGLSNPYTLHLRQALVFRGSTDSMHVLDLASPCAPHHSQSRDLLIFVDVLGRILPLESSLRHNVLLVELTPPPTLGIDPVTTHLPQL